jgi:hypothetical protein
MDVLKYSGHVAHRLLSEFANPQNCKLYGGLDRSTAVEFVTISMRGQPVAPFMPMTPAAPEKRIGKRQVMSLKAAKWAEAQPLTGRKKQLLLAIARAVDETGACRSITQDGLAASCGCTVRQVRRLVNELAAAGYVAHRRRGAMGGGRGPDLYVLPREAKGPRPEVRYREWYGSSKPNVGLKLHAEVVADGIVSRETKGEVSYGVLDPAALPRMAASRLLTAWRSAKHGSDRLTTLALLASAQWAAGISCALAWSATGTASR